METGFWFGFILGSLAGIVGWTILCMVLLFIYLKKISDRNHEFTGI